MGRKTNGLSQLNADKAAGLPEKMKARFVLAFFLSRSYPEERDSPYPFEDRAFCFMDRKEPGVGFITSWAVKARRWQPLVRGGDLK